MRCGSQILRWLLVRDGLPQWMLKLHEQLLQLHLWCRSHFESVQVVVRAHLWCWSRRFFPPDVSTLSQSQWVWHRHFSSLAQREMLRKKLVPAWNKFFPLGPSWLAWRLLMLVLLLCLHKWRSLRWRGLNPSMPPDELIGKCLMEFTTCSLDVSKLSRLDGSSIWMIPSSTGCLFFNFSIFFGVLSANPSWEQRTRTAPLMSPSPIFRWAILMISFSDWLCLEIANRSRI